MNVKASKDIIQHPEQVFQYITKPPMEVPERALIGARNMGTAGSLRFLVVNACFIIHERLVETDDEIHRTPNPGDE